MTIAPAFAALELDPVRVIDHKSKFGTLNTKVDDPSRLRKYASEPA